MLGIAEDFMRIDSAKLLGSSIRFSGQSVHKLMLMNPPQLVQLVFVIQDVHIGDDFAAIPSTFVNCCPVIGSCCLLLSCKKAQMNLHGDENSLRHCDHVRKSSTSLH